MSSLHRHYPALILALTCFGLAALYSVTVPLFETPDEQTHFPFVQHLAQGGGLPVQQPGRPAPWSQEGSQPPLYYALGAALTSWIDTSDLPAVLYANPHADIGVPTSPDNKNLLVHTAREDYPWRGTALAVHLVRFLSALLTAGTVLCTYSLAYAIFPARRSWALGAAAINAAIPMFLFIGGSLNNDNLVTFLASLALAWMAWIVARDQFGGTWGLLGLGTVIGLACLSKLSGLALLALAALALAMLRLQRAGGLGRIWQASWRGILGSYVRDCLLVFGPALAIAGWWYLRNWQLYGDPTGLNVMLDIAGRRATVPGLRDLLDEFSGFRMSFWGLFGHFNVLMGPEWSYRALDALGLLALLGLIPWSWRYARRLSPAQLLTLCLAAVWVLVEAAALVRWTSATMASQGRLIFPAISAICLFLALGLAGWLAVPHDRWVLAGAAGLLACLAAGAPFASIRPAYLRPAPLAADALPATARRLDWTFGDGLRLLAADVDRGQIRPGTRLPVTLYWQALRPVPDDYTVSLKMLAAGQTLAQHDTYPAGGALPTSLWQPGQVMVDRHVLDVPEAAPGPTLAWVVASVYKLGTEETLPVTTVDGQARALTDVAQLILAPPAPTLQPPVAVAPVNFKDQVRLLGYDLPEGPLRPGQAAKLTLYWQVTGKLDRDYAVFVHLLDAEGQTAGQGDGPPLDGFYPTSQWVPGLILTDGHQLEANAGLPAGAYRVAVGFYDRVTGERLPILDATGNPAGDSAELPNLQAVP